MKRIARWLGVLAVLGLIGLIAAAVLLDPIARVAMRKRIESETRLEAGVRNVHIGVRSPTLTIHGLELRNAPEFGGGPFLHIEELHLEYDRELLRQRKLRFKVVRLHLAALNLVEDRTGKTNLQQLQSKQGGKSSGRTNAIHGRLEFAGIEKLDVTIDRASFTSHRNPERSWNHEIGLTNETFNAVENEEDLATIAIVLAIKGGAIFLFERFWSRSR
jgi:hypothetical protein